VADTLQRASSVTSRYGDTVFILCYAVFIFRFIGAYLLLSRWPRPAVSVMHRSGVRPSACLSHLYAAHTQRDSPCRGQSATRPAYISVRVLRGRGKNVDCVVDKSIVCVATRDVHGNGNPMGMGQELNKQWEWEAIRMAMTPISNGNGFP